jgi:hypothetical protein
MGSCTIKKSDADEAFRNHLGFAEVYGAAPNLS